MIDKLKLLYFKNNLKKNIKYKTYPKSFGSYLRSETKRNKKKRLEVIKNWYDFIHSEK